MPVLSAVSPGSSPRRLYSRKLQVLSFKRSSSERKTQRRAGALSPSLLGSDKRGSLSGAPSTSIRLKTQSIDFFGPEIVMPLLSCSCGGTAAAKGREIGCRLQKYRVGQDLKTGLKTGTQMPIKGLVAGFSSE